MKTRVVVTSILLATTALILCGCSSSGPRPIPVEPGAVWIPRCKPLVTYSARSFTIKAIEIPLPKVPIQIGEVIWKPEQLQEASAIVQILDASRMSRCEKLASFASVDHAAFVEALKWMQAEEDRITQLALLVTMNNPEAVQKWVETLRSRADALKTELVVAGHLDRYLPPVVAMIPRDPVEPVGIGEVMPLDYFLQTTR